MHKTVLMIAHFAIVGATYFTAVALADEVGGSHGKRAHHVYVHRVRHVHFHHWNWCPDKWSCYSLYGAYGPFGGAAYWSKYSWGWR